MSQYDIFYKNILTLTIVSFKVTNIIDYNLYIQCKTVYTMYQNFTYKEMEVSFTNARVPC